MLGDAEESGDFLLRKTFDFSEEEHFAAAFGQGVDGFGQQCKFLPTQTNSTTSASSSKTGRRAVSVIGISSARFRREKKSRTALRAMAKSSGFVARISVVRRARTSRAKQSCQDRPTSANDGRDCRR